MSYVNIPLTISASGVSTGFYLPIGEHWLTIKADGWGSATLQHSLNDLSGTYENVKDSSGNNIVITANWNYPVAGGTFYRLNVTAYTNPITVNAGQSSR